MPWHRAACNNTPASEQTTAGSALPLEADTLQTVQRLQELLQQVGESTAWANPLYCLCSLGTSRLPECCLHIFEYLVKFLSWIALVCNVLALITGSVDCCGARRLEAVQGTALSAADVVQAELSSNWKLQVLQPQQCLSSMQPSPFRPSDSKHLRQQASILGHMLAAGLIHVRLALQHNESPMPACFLIKIISRFTNGLTREDWHVSQPA